MRRNASEEKTKEARRINDGLRTKEAPQGEPCEALLLATLAGAKWVQAH